jgi:hypothetical protein
MASSHGRKNNSLYQKCKSCLWYAIPLPLEGRIAIVTDVGSGMRWTWGGSARQTRRRKPFSRTAKSCGPDPPTLGPSSQVTNRGRWRLSSPALQGEREAAVKHHCAGNAGCPGLACGQCRLLSTFAGGPWVRPASGIPCALIVEGDPRRITRAFRAAGTRRRVVCCIWLHRQPLPDQRQEEDRDVDDETDVPED